MINKHGLPVIKAPKRKFIEPNTEEDLLRDQVFAKTNCQCFYCGTAITRKKFTIDHVIPSSRGGKNNIENLVPACAYCNGLKAALSLEDFRNIFEQVFGHRIFTGENNGS